MMLRVGTGRIRAAYELCLTHVQKTHAHDIKGRNRQESRRTRDLRLLDRKPWRTYQEREQAGVAPHTSCVRSTYVRPVNLIIKGAGTATCCTAYMEVKSFLHDEIVKTTSKEQGPTCVAPHRTHDSYVSTSNYCIYIYLVYI